MDDPASTENRSLPAVLEHRPLPAIFESRPFPTVLENRSFPVILIEMLEKCGQTGMRLHEIYAQIEAHYPESIAGKADWKSELRQKLCTYSCFVRTNDPENANLEIWRLKRDTSCYPFSDQGQKAESMADLKKFSWSNAAAVVQILQSSKRRGMWFHEICAQVATQFPELVVGNEKWKDIIRCTLQRNSCFVNVKHPLDLRGRVWKLISDVYLIQDREGKVVISMTRPLEDRIGDIQRSICSLRDILVKILEDCEPPGLSINDICERVEQRYPESISGRSEWRSEVESILHNSSGFTSTLTMPTGHMWCLKSMVVHEPVQSQSGQTNVSPVPSGPSEKPPASQSASDQPAKAEPPRENRPNVWSISALMVKIMGSSKKTGMRTCDLYAHILAHYPDAVAGRHTWRDIVRRNLSKSPWFIKVAKTEGPKAKGFWMLNPEFSFSFVKRKDGFVMATTGHTRNQAIPVSPSSQPIHREHSISPSPSVPPPSQPTLPVPDQQNPEHATQPHAQNCSSSSQCQFQAAIFDLLSNAM